VPITPTTSVFVAPDRVLRGKAGIREAFESLLGLVPDATWDVPVAAYADDLLMIEWSARSARKRPHRRRGHLRVPRRLIRAQTVRYTVHRTERIAEMAGSPTSIASVQRALNLVTRRASGHPVSAKVLARVTGQNLPPRTTCCAHLVHERYLRREDGGSCSATASWRSASRPPRAWSSPGTTVVASAARRTARRGVPVVVRRW
jgi:hypothetical protein